MIRERVEELRRQLEYHNFRYYVENAPEISDFEFDTMMRELQDLERAHPELSDPNSPSVRVGSDITSEFRSVKHRFPNCMNSSPASKRRQGQRSSSAN